MNTIYLYITLIRLLPENQKGKDEKHRFDYSDWYEKARRKMLELIGLMSYLHTVDLDRWMRSSRQLIKKLIHVYIFMGNDVGPPLHIELNHCTRAT